MSADQIQQVDAGHVAGRTVTFSNALFFGDVSMSSREQDLSTEGLMNIVDDLLTFTNADWDDGWFGITQQGASWFGHGAETFIETATKQYDELPGSQPGGNPPVTTDDEALCGRVAALEERIAALAEPLDGAANRDIPLLKGSVRAILDVEIDDIGELPEAGRAFNRQIGTHEEHLETLEEQLAALGDFGTTKTTKQQKLSTICVFVQNKRGEQPATVAVTADEAQGCVGVSRRDTYNLIDAAGESLDGVRGREATEVQTSTDAEHKKKALLVDCEEFL